MVSYPFPLRYFNQPGVIIPRHISRLGVPVARWIESLYFIPILLWAAFLNFGKNYQGARDNYVYTFSQDGPSA